MSEKQGKKPSRTAPETREDRLKQALKANLRRRKDQARARKVQEAKKE